MKRVVVKDMPPSVEVSADSNQIIIPAGSFLCDADYEIILKRIEQLSEKREKIDIRIGATMGIITDGFFELIDCLTHSTADITITTTCSIASTGSLIFISCGRRRLVRGHHIYFHALNLNAGIYDLETDVDGSLIIPYPVAEEKLEHQKFMEELVAERSNYSLVEVQSFFKYDYRSYVDESNAVVDGIADEIIEP